MNFVSLRVIVRNTVSLASNLYIRNIHKKTTIKHNVLFHIYHDLRVIQSSIECSFQTYSNTFELIFSDLQVAFRAVQSALIFILDDESNSNMKINSIGLRQNIVDQFQGISRSHLFQPCKYRQYKYQKEVSESAEESNRLVLENSVEVAKVVQWLLEVQSEYTNMSTFMIDAFEIPRVSGFMFPWDCHSLPSIDESLPTSRTTGSDLDLDLDLSESVPSSSSIEYILAHQEGHFATISLLVEQLTEMYTVTDSELPGLSEPSDGTKTTWANVVRKSDTSTHIHQFGKHSIPCRVERIEALSSPQSIRVLFLHMSIRHHGLPRFYGVRDTFRSSQRRATAEVSRKVSASPTRRSLDLYLERCSHCLSDVIARGLATNNDTLKWLVLLDVSDTLCHLHTTMHVAHGAVRPDNIYVSLHADHRTVTSHARLGPFLDMSTSYPALDIMYSPDAQLLSIHTDVWMFGILVCMLAAPDAAHEFRRWSFLAQREGRGDVVAQKAAQWAAGIDDEVARDVATQCVREIAHDRPSMKAVFMRIYDTVSCRKIIQLQRDYSILTRSDDSKT